MYSGFIPVHSQDRFFFLYVLPSDRCDEVLLNTLKQFEKLLNKRNQKENEKNARLSLLAQKKSPLILRPMPCRSYRMLNLLMNWFMLLHVLVMVPK